MVRKNWKLLKWVWPKRKMSLVKPHAVNNLKVSEKCFVSQTPCKHTNGKINFIESEVLIARNAYTEWLLTILLYLWRFCSSSKTKRCKRITCALLVKILAQASHKNMARARGVLACHNVSSQSKQSNNSGCRLMLFKNVWATALFAVNIHGKIEEYTVHRFVIGFSFSFTACYVDYSSCRFGSQWPFRWDCYI